MMENLICTIGKKTDDIRDESTFKYNNDLYEKLMIWQDFEQLIAIDKKSGFYLQPLSINNIPYLVLCYKETRLREKLTNALLNQRKFVIGSFFEVDEEFQQDTSILDIESDEKEFLTIDNFYDKLKEAHASDDLSSFPGVQHPMLKSTTILRPYQVRGVKWMLKRELQTEYVPTNFIKMKSKFNAQQKYFYNKYTQEFYRHNPEQNLAFPKGGMLCDEMGLGKTLEMITLILMNTTKRGKKRHFEEDMTEEVLERLKPTKKHKVKCVCHSDKKKSMSNMIICKNCFNAQHITCVFQRNITEDDKCNYLCPHCWKSSEKIIQSSTTIVITPLSIKNQWTSEFKRHIADKNFKVLSYNGISNGWISPDELATYDCVVTDFNTLSKELYFTETIDRQLRGAKKFEYPPSPLIHVNWWRVILDEAQMVENKNTRPSQMVKQLPAVNRWCSTGTPIEKGAVHYLYGLIYFLDLHPYDNSEVFNKLWLDYKNGYPKRLIEMLSKVMWRTCKKDVEHEIQIPEQKEIIHYVEMSDLQKCFYQQVHISTKPEFLRHVQNFLMRNSREIDPFTNERRIDHSLMDRKIYELDNTTLKSLMEPLRKIRQDCTIANLFSNTNDQTRVKQTLRAEQLHEHLVSKASIECKSALRTICSSLNGMAAIKIAEMKYDDAMSYYGQVFRFARDYTGVVSVDSMLQIHSYHNMIEAKLLSSNSTDFPEKEEYTREMGKMEWKYISNYYDKVETLNKELDEIKVSLVSATREYSDRNGYWWRDIVESQRTSEEEMRFYEMLNTELMSSAGSQITGAIRSTYGIQLVITEWMDKFERFTNEIMKRFKSLSYIIKNLRPSYELSDEVNEKILNLTQAALYCHLNLEESDDDGPRKISEPKDPRNMCEMCKLKKKLDEYECTLFNKTLVDQNVEGTWNPRAEERLLNAILTYARRHRFDEENIEMGKNFFKYLKALKDRYKLLAQLWVETNYTICAFDEIRMCKMRMQVVESTEELTDEDVKYRLKITRHQTQEQLQIFKSQMQEAEILFTRLHGRIKYLEHLKEKNDNVECPICTNQATERYYVTICGHVICAQCFIILTKDKRRSFMKINCPVCRTSQEIANIYAVTCSDAPSTSGVKITGSYSPKIDEIIRCILKLKEDEPDVKILIFSHWDSILSAIIYGLKENSITYRSSFGSNFNKQIDEFKDYNQGVTCMMLNLKFGGKGLNLTEATHVFLVEPILNADEEMQAVGRIHRIGQTRPTFVHKFITKNTIEAFIFDKIIQEKDYWIHKQFTIRDLEDVFSVQYDGSQNNPVSLY
ncbi:hypothetical protein ACKWTF_009651 [Chironomus riparius]